MRRSNLGPPKQLASIATAEPTDREQIIIKKKFYSNKVMLIPTNDVKKH